MNILLLFLLIFCIPACSMENSGKQEKLDVVCNEKLITPFIDDGVACLKNGQLTKLDPLVGETACHIRAVRVADLYDHVLGGGVLTEYETKVLGAIFLLTKARVIKEKNGDYEEFIEPGNLKPLSRQKAKEIARNMQQFLAADSVAYVRNLARIMKDSDETSKALSVCHHTQHPFNCQSLACFPVVNLIACRTRRPILVRYGAESLFSLTGQQLFAPNSAGSYVPVEFSDIPSAQSVLVFDGISKATSDDIKKIDPIAIFLANAAVHTQFAGKEHKNCDVPYKDLGINALGNLKNEYMQKAEALGVLATNPTSLYIRHVSAGTLGEFKK